ncbi:hypothetical protein [Frankia sp. CcWB3]
MESPDFPPITAPRPVAPSRPVAALMVVLAAVGAGIGSVLPWSEMSSGDETRTFSGLVVGDGRTIGVLAVMLGAIGVGRLVRRPLAGAIDVALARIIAVLIVIITALDRIYGPPTLASFRAISADAISIRPQAGITVCLGAGLLALIGAVLLQPRTKPPRG